MHSLLIGKLECDYGNLMQYFAIYDLDKTITRRATFPPFIWHVLKYYHPTRIWVLPLMGLTSLAFGFKLLSRARLKEINLKLLLGSPIQNDLAQKMAESFARHVRNTNLLKGALDQINEDRAAGYQIVIASASYSFYVEAIARELGIDQILATDCVGRNDAQFLPLIAGENCYGQAKLDRVKALFAEWALDRSQASIRFYSDHVSDAPCLTWADEGFATNPHAPLKSLAQARGWTILNWLSES